MSANICVFHGSEIDDPVLLCGPAQAWYIGAFGGFAGVGEEVDPDSIRGPYTTEQAACEAMAAGAWL